MFGKMLGGMFGGAAKSMSGMAGAMVPGAAQPPPQGGQAGGGGLFEQLMTRARAPLGGGQPPGGGIGPGMAGAPPQAQPQVMPGQGRDPMRELNKYGQSGPPPIMNAGGSQGPPAPPPGPPAPPPMAGPPQMPAPPQGPPAPPKQPWDQQLGKKLAPKPPMTTRFGYKGGGMIGGMMGRSQMQGGGPPMDPRFQN